MNLEFHKMILISFLFIVDQTSVGQCAEKFTNSHLCEAWLNSCGKYEVAALES